MRTKEEAKSLYASAKDTLSGWLGGKEHAGLERKDDVDRAVEGTQDAIARNVNKASDTVRIGYITLSLKSQVMHCSGAAATHRVLHLLKSRPALFQGLFA